MAASVESSSPDTLFKGSNRSMGSSPMFSPSSDKRFWSTLRNRVDSLLENQKPPPALQSLNGGDGEVENRAKRLKEDSLLLLRGFDSVSHTLSQLSNNIETALQGARDLARPPTLSDMVHNAFENVNSKDKESEAGEEEDEDEKKADDKRGLKRKLGSQENSEDDEQAENSKTENGKTPKELGKKLNRAKNIAISMAKKAASLAREMKSIKSDLCFMQERCSLLEEENKRLRQSFAKGIQPEEDDLVRLQLEALLAEKSRLANENANLTRENQCLNQLVEYHQLTSQEVSDDAYEHVLRGTCLDFSSPPLPIPEEDEEDIDADSNEAPKTPLYGFSFSLDHE